MASETTCKYKMLLTVFFCAAMVLLMFSACAPEASNSNHNDEESGLKTADTVVEIQWSPKSECSACHAKQSDSMTDSSCDAALHADMNCIDCHENTEVLSKVHEGVTSSDRAATRLKQTSVEKELCVECHPNNDAYIAGAEGSMLVDINGKTVNPHNLPENNSHLEIVCSDCHEMHGKSDAKKEKAEKLCQSCHHANVYECYTCHEHG